MSATDVSSLDSAGRLDGERQRLLQLLSEQGFSEADRWLEYARRHGFRSTASRRLSCCPNCGARAFAEIGQYVWYSTLARLRSCRECGLAYSDTRLDPEITRLHFEHAYKDEDYFRRWRRRALDQLARLIDRLAPPGGSVLDVGGAKGHLLDAVRHRRPDLQLTLNDVSAVACAWAQAAYGLATVCGPIGALEQTERAFDVVVMSDVLYYEPDLAAVWRLLPRLVTPGGTLMIRAPNTLLVTRLWQFLVRCVNTARGWARRDHVAFFNPEHLYVLSRGLLSSRLRTLGFEHVTVRPAEMPGAIEKKWHAITLYYQIATLAHTLSFRHLILTPSFVMLATRRK